MTREQVSDGLKEPELLLEKITVAVGGVGEEEVSVTVAVQEVAWLTATVEGVQLTVVAVGRMIDTSPILLANCSVNQILRSGPTVMPRGALNDVGTAYSVKEPVVVTFPILLTVKFDSVNHRLASGPAVIPNG